jgi:hypothetical protein
MPWAHATVRHDCNRCRRPVPVGAWAYRGETTRATWCADCGQEQGFGGEPAERVDRGMAAFAELLAAFKKKHGPAIYRRG